MATYTSVQNGNWNDPATWGGSGYPSVAGDIANVNHTVTYNVSSTVELGQININSGGILTFATDMSTKLTLGHQDIVINSGGKLWVGTEASPIPKDYIAEIPWNTTSDNAKGITINNGGECRIYGDPDYYGSDDDTYLYSNWTSGSTIYVEGDFSTKWKAGQEIYIHKGTNYSNYNTDVFKATISGNPVYDGTKTTITIAEAHPGGTFYAGGIVVNASRNVRLSKLNASTVIGNYNSNRPRILNNSALRSYGSLYVKDTIFTGFHSLHQNGNSAHVYFENCVIRNGYAALAQSAYGHIIKGSLISLNNGSVGSYFDCSARIFCCSSVTTANSSFGILSGDIYSNNNGIWGSKLTVSGQLFANSRACNGGIDSIYSSSFGWCRSVSMKNTYDIYNDCRYNTPSDYVILSNAKLPSTGLVYGSRYYPGKVLSEHHGQVKDAHYKYDGFGDVIKNTSITRPNGASTSIEVIPTSYCSSECPLQVLGQWIEENVPPVQQTRSVKIKGEGWTTFPTASELYLEAEYLDQSSGIHTATVQSVAVLTDNTTWTDFPVTFTPAQKGKVIYRVYLKKYASACKIYIDNALYRDSVYPYFAYWQTGESHLYIDYEKVRAFNVINGCHFIRRAA